jgi:hypothetical protein
MPGMTPQVKVSAAPALSERELHDKKKRAVVAALIDLGACTTRFRLQALEDPSDWDPMALAAAMMLMIEHGGAPEINRARAKQAVNDYMMVWRRATFEKPAA